MSNRIRKIKNGRMMRKSFKFYLDLSLDKFQNSANLLSVGDSANLLSLFATTYQEASVRKDALLKRNSNDEINGNKELSNTLAGLYAHMNNIESKMVILRKHIQKMREGI